MATGPRRTRAARYLDALLHRGPGYDLTTTATAHELTAEEARALADDLGLQLYRAQDALAFVKECCVIAEREQHAITPADVCEWLKGAQCGRQLAAGDAGQRQDGEKSSRQADATPQHDDALTLECSKLTCLNRAPLSEARETWIRPAGEYGWLCPDCATDFFQPGHTYRHSAWSFRCDALTTHPDTGERVALGWFRFSDQRCRPFTAGGGHWRDITEPACDSEPASRATTDTPGEGT